MFCYRLGWLILTMCRDKRCVCFSALYFLSFQLGWTTLTVYFNLFKPVSGSTVGFHLLSVSTQMWSCYLAFQRASITADIISYMYLWCKALPWYNIFIWNLSFYFGRPTSCFIDNTEWELPCYWMWLTGSFGPFFVNLPNSCCTFFSLIPSWRWWRSKRGLVGRYPAADPLNATAYTR